MIEGADASHLVAAAAEAMDAASVGAEGLVFVRGLTRQQTDALCDAFEVAVAIVNPGNAFVVGGSDTALRAFEDGAVTGAQLGERGGASGRTRCPVFGRCSVATDVPACLARRSSRTGDFTALELFSGPALGMAGDRGDDLGRAQLAKQNAAHRRIDKQHRTSFTYQ